MEHLYKDKGAKTTFVLFHGTGGDEHDLVPIGEMMDSSANVLSLRGTVNESGMLRYFKRLKPGVFDEVDLKKRTMELAETLDTLCKHYDLEKSFMILIGYSNGANIISSYLSLYGNTVQGAILLHPMTPYEKTVFPKMNDFPLFISAGRNDPIVDRQDTLNLHKLYEKSNALVELYWHDSGHQLTNGAIKAATEFYNTHIK